MSRSKNWGIPNKSNLKTGWYFIPGVRNAYLSVYSVLSVSITRGTACYHHLRVTNSHIAFTSPFTLRRNLIIIAALEIGSGCTFSSQIIVSRLIINYKKNIIQSSIKKTWTIFSEHFYDLQTRIIRSKE